MKKGIVFLPILLCLLVANVAPNTSAQDTAKLANVAGAWTVTITASAKAHATTGTKTTEMWTVEQKGGTLTGKVKTSSGGDATLDGTVAGLDGDVIQVTEKIGDDQLIIEATAVGDSMSGTIRSYKNKTENLWSAKRTK